MFKKRYFSIKYDFKTGLYYKLFMFLGIVLLIISLFLKIISFITNGKSSGFNLELFKLSQTHIPNSILAFAIIFFAIAVIFYFFNYQFSKLKKIFNELENHEDIYKMEKTEDIKEVKNIRKIENFENK